MADVEHNALTGASLHEPKGVAAANDNEVYVADGATSGTHKQITSANLVMVHSASDFPTAVAGVRTLVANTVYHVVGAVSIGSDRLVGAAGSVLRGDNSIIDGLTTTNAGAMLTSTENLILLNLGFTCTSGDLFALTGGGVDSLYMSNCRITNCDTLGTLTTMAHVHILDTYVVACVTKGLTFAGVSGHVDLIGNELDSTLDTILDFGASTWDHIILQANDFKNPTGVDAITIAASGANLKAAGIGFILDNFIETVATATAGYTVGDLKWIVKGNPGIENNSGGAQGSITNSATATTFSGTGAGNDVVVNFSTSWVSDVTDKFTQSTAGVFTYTGIIPIKVMVNAQFFSIISGGAARTYNYYIAKDGTIIASSVAQVEYDGTLGQTHSCQSLVDVVTGSTITLRVRAETATTSLTVDTCAITMHEV